MMIQKNLELQLQTLNIIEQKADVTSSTDEQKNSDSADTELPIEHLQKEMYENFILEIDF